MKVKFSNDQFRPALGSGCRLIDRLIVFFLGHTQDLYFSALGYETQSGMGFQINWYYIAFLHWSSWSWLHLLLHLIDFQLSRQVASCGEGDLAR